VGWVPGWARSTAYRSGKGSCSPGEAIWAASWRANIGLKVNPVEATQAKKPGTSSDSPTTGDMSSVKTMTPDQVRTTRASPRAGTTSSATARLPAALCQRVG
jgi:hypothetical protein